VNSADTSQPGADLQPIEDAREQPEKKPPAIPEEGKPKVKDTEVQPT